LIHDSLLALVVDESFESHGNLATRFCVADIDFLLEVDFELTGLSERAFDATSRAAGARVHPNQHVSETGQIGFFFEHAFTNARAIVAFCTFDCTFA